MKYKSIFWGIGEDYNKYINLIKYQILQNSIEAVGIISNSTIYRIVDGYPFVEKVS